LQPIILFAQELYAWRDGPVAGRVAGLHSSRAHAAPEVPCGAAKGDARIVVLLQPRFATGQAGVDGTAPPHHPRIFFGTD